MDIAEIPIVDFLKYCKAGAQKKGFNWLVCILSRARDSMGLYPSIERDWMSLDNITGNNMLVLFAGNEVKKDIRYDYSFLENSCITDRIEGYVKRYSPFATVIGNSGEITTDLSSERYRILENHIKNVEQNQTDAVNSLRHYFGLREQDIPCLVYVPLYENVVPVSNIVVSLPKDEADLYSYFKRVFNTITPLVDKLQLRGNKLYDRITCTYTELICEAKKSPRCEMIMECIQQKKYATIEQPARGLLSRYIDLCIDYKEKYGIEYSEEIAEKAELFKEIEKAFVNVDIPIIAPTPVNAYISIGDNNRIKNSTISVVVQKQENR